MASLMLAGTGSDVGKSLLTAGLCRAYQRRGIDVLPFKPQNMSNNAAVTADGGEIGRAQALQAHACKAEPHTDMNPILLKPQSETGSQVVVQGHVWGTARAGEYQGMKPRLLPSVLESFERLRRRAELVLVEGAGSIAEINLRAGDIANLGFAEAAEVPVVLVGDIDRGGVIAAIVGTYALLRDDERQRLKGYLINKFRGDPRLFERGTGIIGERTGWRAFGVVPYFAAAGRLPAEDAIDVVRHGSDSQKRDRALVRIAVPVLSRIANFDDLDPLMAEPDVAVDFIAPGHALPGDADLVVLPGSKSTVADLKHLRAQGWDTDILAHLRRGGWLLGICGGYQMLGQTVSDPKGVEGKAASIDGLGLLNISTELGGEKTLVQISGHDVASGAAVHGYEIHLGKTTGAGLERPMLELDGRPDGAASANGKVMGCYLHGLFVADRFRRQFLNRLCRRHSDGIAYQTLLEETLDALAAHLESHVDLDRLLAVANGD